MDYANNVAWPSRRGEAARRARIERRLSPSSFLSAPLRSLNYDSTAAWAWNNYRATVLGIAEACRDRAGNSVRMLEVGGGRAPMFTPAEAAAAGLAVSVNDIDERELSLGPPEFGKALFDIAAEVSPSWHGGFDLIASHMVMEHVRDARKAWSNMAALLAPSGVAIAFHPTLYAPPFLINALLPDRLTAPLLRLFFPARHDGVQPKFPAWYDMCVSDLAKVEPMLKACGFRETLIVPFWGHDYFRSLPGLREIDDAVQGIAEARDWRALSSYAFSLARR
ncbi:MAG TPA: methyltransferase domain-containing protein [Roseiarcus sp.]|nr:methyltransferase domain-containing protein [Roseiarcus sp.]